MSGVYSDNAPGFRVGPKDKAKKFYPDVDGNFTDGIPGEEGDPFYLRPEGYWDGGNDWTEDQVPDASQDYLAEDPTGKSTNDLISEDGTVKTFLPPNSRDFILGPLVDGYVPNHGYDNYTNIGYIQKDTRQFVLLARIQGQFTADLHSAGARVWDGTESQLTVYNSSFTLAMAEWFRDQITAGTSTSNVPYFYSGGVPQQELNVLQCPNCPPNMFGGVTPGTRTGGGFGTGTPPSLGSLQEPPKSGNQVTIKVFNLSPEQVTTLAILLGLGLTIAAVIAVLFPEPTSSAAGATYLASKFRFAAGLKKTLSKLWKSKPQNYPKRSNLQYPKKSAEDKFFDTVDKIYQQSKGKPLSNKPVQGKAGRKRFPVGDSYDHITDVKLKLILETYDKALLNEVAPTGSGAGGGTDVADVYVNNMTNEHDADQLQQASDDANDIAKEGGKGLSDAELKKIDKQAEDLAKKLNNVNHSRPESMSQEQIDNFYDMAFSTDPEWLEQNFNKYESLIDTKAAEKAYEDYKTQRDYLYSEEYYRTFSGYAENKDLADSLWPSVRGHETKYYDHRYDENGKVYAYAVAVYKNGVKLGPDATRSWYNKLHDWADAHRAHYKVFYDDILPQQKIEREKASNTYTTASNKAFRAFDMAMIRAWSQRNVNDDPFSLEDLTPGEIANMSPAEKRKLKQTLAKLGISYGDIASVDVMNLGVDATAAVLSLGIAGIMGLYNVTVDAATNFVNAVSTSDPYGTDQAGPTTTGNNPRAKDLTPEQQAEVEAAGQELKDAGRALQDLPADATDAQRDAAQERYDRATKNRQRLRRKHREENKHRKESYKPKFRRNRETLTETRTPRQRRILREIKQPVKVKDAPTKYKMNFSGKYSPQNTPDKTASSESDALVASGNEKGRKWREEDKRWSGYETTERMNIIHDRVGHGSQYWERMLDEAKEKNNWRTREVQEELNKIAHEKAMLKENPDYRSPFGNGVEVEDTTTKNVQNFERVTKIKKVVADTKPFNNKEIKPEYPDDEDKEKDLMLKMDKQITPAMKKEFEGEKAQTGENAAARYKRLDPISAKSMPDAAYPQIDALRDQAKKKLKTFENFDNPNKKKLYEKIAKQETKYLRYFVENFSVPKYYDWESGEFNELAEINKVVLKRLGTIEDALSEGMTTKVFKYLYGGVVTHDIVSLNPNLVSSTFAQDLIGASSQVTSHMFGPDFPGSHINSIGDFDKPESLSKVDVQAHITTDHEVSPNEGEMAHPENHVFTYQSEGNSIKWPTEYTFPDSFSDDLMYFDAEGNPQEWIHYIWPVHGHPGNYTPLNSSKDDTPFWLRTQNATEWGFGDSDGRMQYNDGRIDRRSITDTSFDVTFGAARSIDSTAFDLTGNMDAQPYAQGEEAYYGVDVNDIAAVNALRSQWRRSTSETGLEDWQYIRDNTQTGYIDQIYGIDFPFAEYDYDPYESDHTQFHGTDGWERIHPNLNTNASWGKKIIKNVQVGDKISFSYKWYSDTWMYETENYSHSSLIDEYVHDGVRYGDHDWNSSYFRAIIGANNKVVSIKDQWQRIGADPSLTLTDGTYTIPPLPNPNNPEDNDLYFEYNITKKDNGFSYPYSGTYEYTVQKGDIDAAGLFQFTTILLAESTNLEYVQITNFAHTVGDQTRTAAGQLGKTTDAYNLGTSVASLDPNSKKKKKKKDEEDDETDSKVVGSTKDSTEQDQETDSKVVRFTKGSTKQDQETDSKVVGSTKDSTEQDQVDVDTDTSTEPEVKQEVKEFENVPDNEEQEEQIIDDLEQQEQEEDEQIEQEKETDEIESEKEKFLDELQGDEETTEDEKNIFSDIFDKVIDYTAEITGHRTSKEVLKLYNSYLKGADYVQRHINSDGEVDLVSGFSNTGDTNPYVSYKDQAYLRSALNDPEFERIHAKAMNANNEKSKHLYLHALGDKVEAKIQDYILGDKGLRNSLFQGVKLDRNAFLQSNGKYISFTKDYKFRPGGSVAEAEKSWVGKLLSGFGFKLDTLGSGNLIDKIGGLLAGKLIDGTDDLYNAPAMPMRLNLHYRGRGNRRRIPYRSNGWTSNVNNINPVAIRGGYVNRGSWWEEDPELGAMQEISSYEYSQNYTPELIGPDHRLNPRTGEWELPPRNERGFRRWDNDDSWWLDPDFVDLSGYGKEKEKEKQPTDNFYDDLSATDAATLVAFQRKKKRGQGGSKKSTEFNYDPSKTPFGADYGEVSQVMDGEKLLPQELQDILNRRRGKSPALGGTVTTAEKKKIAAFMITKDAHDLLINDPDTYDRLERALTGRIPPRNLYPGKTPQPKDYYGDFLKGGEVDESWINWIKKLPKKKLLENKNNALYPGQPSPNGFPDTPPPKMINGRHPEFGKQARRYRRLDPISAKTMSMVKTGDPETDKQVNDQAKKPKVEGNSTWSKLKEYRQGSK